MSETDHTYGQLATSIAGIAGTLYFDPTVRGTLQRIVDFAVSTVEGADMAGISLVSERGIETPVYSEPHALEVDNIQYETGEGPCLDAIEKKATIYSEDLADDERWPLFGPRAAALGLRSLLSCRLSAEDATLGALNLYARLPRAYGAIDRTKAVIFAAHAGVALGVAKGREEAGVLLDREIGRLEYLRGALASREVIGQAEGILIERERITADQAFQVLRRASQHLNIKLREVAAYLVETGEVPPGS